MIKATLQYTDCLQDGRNVYMVLTALKIPIVKTKDSFCHPKIIALFKDYDELPNALYQLNNNCVYEVRLVKYKTIKENRPC